ncbi:MAG: helix-turn-helix transcriptional regulator [Gemmatirosa sp.]|nr:helix-turn-helix transcriptional regulator [Gemmatirosa sp.]
MPLPDPPATLIVVAPPPDLAPVVEYVWQLVLAPGAPGTCWRVVPDGYVDLSVRVPVDAEPLRAVARQPWSVAARREAIDLLAGAPALVCGAAAGARTLPMNGPRLLTGARFRLGAAAAVLRDDLAPLVDGARALDDVLGARSAGTVATARADDGSRHVHAYGCSGPTHPDEATVQQVLRAIARASVVAAVRRLVARAERASTTLAPDPRVRDALRLLDASATEPATSLDAAGARVARLCRELSTSKRTLERLFAGHVGFAPRTYQRLRRVGAVAEALERGRHGTLSEIAYRLGYADHAHMTREFGGVMGVSPSRYRREALDAPVARRGGAVALERTTPVGTVGTMDRCA